MSDLSVAQWRGTFALAARETRRVLSLWTQTILPGVTTALLFLAVFGGALGSRLRTIEGIPYLEFILPGLLVMTVAGQAFANSSTSLFQAKNEGYVESVLSSPIRPAQLVAAYAAGGLVRAWLSAALVALAASLWVGAPEHPALLVAALVLSGLFFSVLGVITGAWADTFDQHAFVANLVIAPLALVGGVFYAARSLSEPWSTLTRVDPLFYLVDLARAGQTGFHEAELAPALVVGAAAASLVFVTASRLLARGWRLRP